MPQVSRSLLLPYSASDEVQACFLQFVAGPALQQAAGQTIEAFQKRAVQVYGKR